jgi:PAS domain S-box-containing protein
MPALSDISNPIEDGMRLPPFAAARVIGVALIVAVVIGISTVVYSRIDHQLDRSREAESDNRTWVLAQLEVDLQRLQIGLLRAIQENGAAPQLEDVRLAYDILFSRVDLMRGSKTLDDLPLRDSAGWADLAGDAGLVKRMESMMNASDPALKVALPRLAQQVRATAPGAREAIVASLEASMAEGDLAREDLRKALRGFSMALIAIVGALVLLVLTIYVQWRQQARQAGMLKLAVRNLRSVVEASHDGVLLITEAGWIVGFNQSARAMLGVMPVEAGRRRHVWQIMQCEDFDALEGCVRHRLECHRVDGSALPVEITVVSAGSGSGKRFLIAFLRDMSAQIDHERQMNSALATAQQGEEAKSRFLAVMSHEMRTPLNGLIAAIDILETTTPLDAHQGWLTEIMRGCAQAALEQVNNVLQLTHLASIEGGDHARTVFSLPEMLQQQVQQFQAGALHRGNKLVCQIGPEGQVAVHASLHLLRRALNNLLSNAVKFTSDGRIVVALEVQPAERPGWLALAVSVIDSGIGIAPGNLERIFHNFETLDSSYSRVQEGSGLGLGIAKLAMEAMGGKIEVESTPGIGSRFTLRFEAETRAAPVAEPPPPAPRLDPGVEYDLLVAEDNEVNRVLLVRQLERFGHRVTAVDNGQAAVDAVMSGGPFDAIVMDVSMPGMDGLTATRLLRAEGPAVHTPIIALTAQADSARAETFRAGGMTEVLTKPVQTERLLALIQSLLLQRAVPPHPQAGSNMPAALIDTVAIRELIEDLGVDFLHAMAGNMRASLQASLADLEAAATQRDLPRVADIAHQAAGGTAALGFAMLSQELARLERHAREGVVESAPALLARLGDLVRQSEAQFNTLLSAP